MRRGRHIADQNTLVHFVVGLGAGSAGIDPKMALLITLLAEGTYEVVRSRTSEVLFEREQGNSKANEILNLLSIVAGAHLGMLVRETWQQAHPSAPTAPAPSAATSAEVAGLGLVIHQA